MTHIHILGISGTFMSALALLARDLGYKVTGNDAQCYPPVSDLLRAKDITWIEGYEDSSLALQADIVVVGNAIKRGMPVLEAVMNAGIKYSSGPQWLSEYILSRYKVIAVSGTHGKTTTTSMIAWILAQAGLNPGFLIGGVAPNFNTNSCLGTGNWFVIEADEYDSAFFDKRPKFMHYRPQIAILNNLEFDHADIYEHLDAIKQQFHYFLRTIPGKGVVLKPRDDQALNAVVSRGIYSRCEQLSLSGPADWTAELISEDGALFKVCHMDKEVAQVDWSLIGRFNVENALAAIAASYHAGVEPQRAAKALENFTPVKRRLEIKSSNNGITIYDDFAHHPTAISKTIDALRQSMRHKRIFVVMEFASYTMRTGIHAEAMPEALALADEIYILEPEEVNFRTAISQWPLPISLYQDTTQIVNGLADKVRSGDAILVMSNRGFQGIHQQLAQQFT